MLLTISLTILYSPLHLSNLSFCFSLLMDPFHPLPVSSVPPISTPALSPPFLSFRPLLLFTPFLKSLQFGDSQQLRLVRILRSTVMVRVGGGWMALDEFLVKNDPCRGEKFTHTHGAFVNTHTHTVLCTQSLTEHTPIVADTEISGSVVIAAGDG